MRSDTEIYVLLADADPVADTDALDTAALTARIESALGHRLATSAADPTRKETTMVTRQQSDLEIPTPTPPPRSRRSPLVAAAVAVVVILAGVGIAFATGAFESEGDVAADRLAVATDLVDTWSQGWEDGNPELVTSVFTDDGVYIDPGAGGAVAVTTDNMENLMVSKGGATSGNRVSDLSPSGDNTYTWVQEFDQAGNRYRGDMEIELEGDLAQRIAWLGSGYREVAPASDS